jgi:Arc/MetJ family transcription regulator
VVINVQTRLDAGAAAYRNLDFSLTERGHQIDDALMAQAQEACGHATKKQTVEEALRLMVRLRQQKEAASAFGKYRWRGNLAQSRKGRGIG